MQLIVARIVAVVSDCKQETKIDLILNVPEARVDILCASV